MNVKAVTFVTSLFISMGVPAMDKNQSQHFKPLKTNQQQVITGLDNIFTGQVAIKPLTDVTDSINASSAYVSFNANARSFWHTHPKGQYLIVTEGEDWCKNGVNLRKKFL